MGCSRVGSRRVLTFLWGFAELLSVGQKNNALDVLEIVIKSKRHRQWAPILEEILKKFLFLCTESRNARKAKDGLIGYRSIASNHVQGPESLLKVVTSFIEDGEKAVSRPPRLKCMPLLLSTLHLPLHSGSLCDVPGPRGGSKGRARCKGHPCELVGPGGGGNSRGYGLFRSLQRYQRHWQAGQVC